MGVLRPAFGPKGKLTSCKEFRTARRGWLKQLRWLIGSMAALGMEPVATLPLDCPLPCPRNHLPATLSAPTWSLLPRGVEDAP